MKFVSATVFLLFGLFTACLDRPLGRDTVDAKPATVSNPTPSNATSTAYDSTISSGRRGGGGGGGGGGGNSERNAPIFQKISLDQTADAQNQSINFDRKIIRNADISLEAESPETSLQKITTIAESKGGFVVESQESSSDVKTTEHDVVAMAVRVPAAKFNEALEEIRKSASRVIVENVKGDDVTEEFIDIEARLKAQKALETQFIEIMKRANSVDDALNVQRELAEVRGEIEKVEGRKRFLENQSSLSTIKIRIQTPTVFAASTTGFFYRLAQSFTAGFDFALNFVLGLVTFIVAILPFALIFGLPAFFIVRYFWKRQSRPRSFSDIAKEELETE